MPEPQPRGRLVVVALFDPVTAGMTIHRRQWPEHVTLAANFVVDEADERVLLTVHRAVATTPLGGALSARIADSAMFGPNADIPVQLVESAPILALHVRLADLLEAMHGFVADDPEYWRAGYRPHATIVPHRTFEAGEVHSLEYVAVARLGAEVATIIDVITLPLDR